MPSIERWGSNALAVPAEWDDDARTAVLAALEKLCDLHDRKRDAERMENLVEALNGSGASARAVLLGLQRLMTEDVKRLTYFSVLKAAQEYIEREDAVLVPCEDCGGRGLVILRDDTGRSFSLACRCPNAAKFRRQGFAPWTGEAWQFTNGRRLDRPT